MAREPERIVHVTTQKEAGGITATVVTDQGNVHTGRDHPSYHFNGGCSADRAIQEATKKVNN